MNAAGSRKRVLPCFVGFLIVAGVSGCVNLPATSTLPGVSSDAEMNAPLKPSFPQPELRTPSAPRPAAMLYGQWEAVQVTDMKSVTPATKYSNTMVFTATHGYVFSDDGTCQTTTRVGDQETTAGGKWSCDKDILTLNLGNASGKTVTMRFKLLWYGDDQFEMRYADLEEYRKLLSVGEIRDLSCTYDDRGCMTTRMTIQGSTTTMLESPLVLERKK